MDTFFVEEGGELRILLEWSKSPGIPPDDNRRGSTGLAQRRTKTRHKWRSKSTRWAPEIDGRASDLVTAIQHGSRSLWRPSGFPSPHRVSIQYHANQSLSTVHNSTVWSSIPIGGGRVSLSTIATCGDLYSAMDHKFLCALLRAMVSCSRPMEQH